MKALVKAIVPNSPQWYRRRLYCTKAACYRLYNQTAIQQIATIPKKSKSILLFLLENLHWCVFRKIVLTVRWKVAIFVSLSECLTKYSCGRSGEKVFRKKNRQIAVCERQRIARKLCNSVSIWVAGIRPTVIITIRKFFFLLISIYTLVKLR